jgi:DNA-binding response OmpR family regulator
LTFRKELKMYNILVVDDEARIRSIIKKYAEFEGHTVTEAGDGMEAVRLCRKETYDMIIMDIMMPELDGFSACREIRKVTATPIIMLSARGEEYDKINGFELGIDDYVVKPFSPKELMLRIEAIMKRVGSPKGGAEQVKKQNVIVELDGGGLRADLTARIVYINGERVEMSPKEYDLFFYMLDNRNIALSREKLISEVWGYDFYGDARTLDTHIKLLRKSLGDYSKYIVTLRGVGYRFEGEA